jgi:hypothetical protein
MIDLAIIVAPLLVDDDARQHARQFLQLLKKLNRAANLCSYCGVSQVQGEEWNGASGKRSFRARPYCRMSVRRYRETMPLVIGEMHSISFAILPFRHTEISVLERSPSESAGS